MLKVKKSFPEIVRERLKELRTNAFAVEQSNSMKRDFIRSVIREDKEKPSVPSIDKARAICEALGLEFYIGPERTGQTSTFDDLEKYVKVKRVPIQLSAGPGKAAKPPAELEPIIFQRNWLHSIGLRPSECRAMTVEGNSMVPTLCDGDMVLIDTRDRKTIRNGIVYAVIIENQSFIKRLERVEGILMARSDNTSVPTRVIADEGAGDFRVLGPVVWSARKWDLR